MSDISLDGTAKTPEVKFAEKPISMSLSGRSIPENSIEFYKPIIDWIGNYSQNSKPDTVLNVQLEYFNTN